MTDYNNWTGERSK